MQVASAGQNPSSGAEFPVDRAIIVFLAKRLRTNERVGPAWETGEDGSVPKLMQNQSLLDPFKVLSSAKCFQPSFQAE